MPTLRITDAEILDWIESGLLVVNYPSVYFRGRRMTPELVRGRGERNRGQGYRYAYRFRFNGRRRRIVRSKLVWMTEHRQVVPSGHELHHRDDDRLNDAIENLELLSSDEHFALHNPEALEY